MRSKAISLMSTGMRSTVIQRSLCAIETFWRNKITKKVQPVSQLTKLSNMIWKIRLILILKIVQSYPNMVAAKTTKYKVPRLNLARKWHMWRWIQAARCSAWLMKLVRCYSTPKREWDDSFVQSLPYGHVHDFWKWLLGGSVGITECRAKGCPRDEKTDI